MRPMVGRNKRNFSWFTLYSLILFYLLLLLRLRFFFLIQAKRFCKLHAFILMRANLQRSLDKQWFTHSKNQTRKKKRKSVLRSQTKNNNFNIIILAHIQWSMGRKHEILGRTQPHKRRDNISLLRFLSWSKIGSVEMSFFKK